MRLSTTVYCSLLGSSSASGWTSSNSGGVTSPQGVWGVEGEPRSRLLAREVQNYADYGQVAKKGTGTHVSTNTTVTTHRNNKEPIICSKIQGQIRSPHVGISRVDQGWIPTATKLACQTTPPSGISVGLLGPQAFPWGVRWGARAIP